MLGNAKTTWGQNRPDVVHELHKLVDVGNLDEAEYYALNLLAPQRHDYVTQNSPTRLVYYVAGYVARKVMEKTGCRPCSGIPTIPWESAGLNSRNQFIVEFSRSDLFSPPG